MQARRALTLAQQLGYARIVQQSNSLLGRAKTMRLLALSCG